MAADIECPKCGTTIKKYNVVTASFLGLAPCPKCKKHVKYIETPANPVDCMVSRQDTFGGAKVLDDGFGNTWINQCGNCKKIGTLEIVRPGKVQCRYCG
jgi:hypothetical protein